MAEATKPNHLQRLGVVRVVAVRPAPLPACRAGGRPNEVAPTNRVLQFPVGRSRRRIVLLPFLRRDTVLFGLIRAATARVPYIPTAISRLTLFRILFAPFADAIMAAGLAVVGPTVFAASVSVKLAERLERLALGARLGRLVHRIFSEKVRFGSGPFLRPRAILHG